MKKFVVKLIKAIIGEKSFGALKYYCFPTKRTAWGGPFNGQQFRSKIFLELVETFDFGTIFETGTFRGTTTEFMLNHSKATIYTVELLSGNYGYCHARFKANKRVHLFHDDSRLFLQQHLASGVFCDVPVFFYLDAHWGKDLPLLEECQIIIENNIQAVIMIDDFEVHDDPGYKFDDFGKDKRLTLEYLNPLQHCEVTAFFPNCPSERETGAKRGCVVLGIGQNIGEALQGVNSLIKFRKW